MTFEEWIDDNMEFLHDSTILGDLRLAFNAGLEAGRPKWHNLRKNPEDLPESLRAVWVKVVEPSVQGHVDYIVGYYWKGFDEWADGDDYDDCQYIYHVVAWCELPKFEEAIDENKESVR